MKRICQTFLACASIIGSAQCLFAANQPKPLASEIQVEDTNIIKVEEATSNISPEFIQLSSVNKDRQMNEQESDEQYTLDQLLTEKAIELVDKGDKDLFRVAKTIEEKAEDIEKQSAEEPEIILEKTEAENEIIIEDEPRVDEKELTAEIEPAEAEPAVEEKKAVVTEEEKTVEPVAEEAEEKTEPSPEETVITVTATAYSADCEGGSGVTYTGIDLKENPDTKVIAVDPSVIPLGTEVYVEGYGHAIAADIGGAIKGNKIDVFIPNQDDAESWGVQTVDVTIMP